MAENNDLIIEEFISTLVKDKGLDDLDPEILEQVKSDLKDRLNDRINAIILSKMPPEQLGVFEEKLGKLNNDEEVDEYIASQVPDLKNIIAQEFLAFRAAYLYP